MVDKKKSSSKPVKSLEEPKKDCFFKQLQDDHSEFKNTFKDLTDSNLQIEQYTKKTVEILEKSHEENIDVLKIIAGKKQVPLSIFFIVVGVLSALLITTEVKYSGLDIEINTSGIHISKSR